MNIVPLQRTELASIAPNYEAMRRAIDTCDKVDEIANLADKAVAVQAYFRQSQDVDNEMQCSRMRMRAERRLGEILKAMAENGERVSQGGDRSKSHGATLLDLGIPKDRASRAMQLAEVPQTEFEAALSQNRVAQPRRILDERKPLRGIVPIDQTLALWGKVRDLGGEIESGKLPPLDHWRENLQPFQIAHLRRYVPLIIRYLTTIQEELGT